MSGTAHTPPTNEEPKMEPSKPDEPLHIIVLCKSEEAFPKFFKSFDDGDEAKNSESTERNIYNWGNVRFYVFLNEVDYSMNSTCNCTLLLFSETDKLYFMNMAAVGRRLMVPMISVMMDLDQDDAVMAANAIISVTETDETYKSEIYNVKDIHEVKDAVKKFDFRHFPSFKHSDDDDRSTIKAFFANLHQSPYLSNPCKIFEVAVMVDQNAGGTTSVHYYIISVPQNFDIAVVRHRIKAGQAGIFVILAKNCTQEGLTAIKIILAIIAKENNAKYIYCTCIKEAKKLGLAFDPEIWLFTTCNEVAKSYFNGHMYQRHHDSPVHQPDDDCSPRNLSEFEQRKLHRDNRAKKAAKGVVSYVTGPTSDSFDLSSLEDAVVKPPANKSSKKKNKKHPKKLKKAPQVEDLSKEVPKPPEANMLSPFFVEEIADTAGLAIPAVRAVSFSFKDTPKDVSSSGSELPSPKLDSHRVALNTNLPLPRPFVNCSPHPIIDEREMKRQLEILRQAHYNFFFNPDGTPDEKVMMYLPPEGRDDPLVYKMPLREYNERFGLPQPRFKPKPEEPKDIDMIDRTKTPTSLAPENATDTTTASGGNKRAMKKRRPGKN